jgi:uncharacterized protein YgbK (DUF1537 family)
VLLIGDDLTGTNAAAAIYTRNGLKAVTALGEMQPSSIPPDVQVIACSTDSRHLSPRQAAERVTAAVKHFGCRSQTIVKRFDTTLRGNIGAEIAACLGGARELHPETHVVGLIVPAFPAAQRSTVGGYQLFNGLPISMGPAAFDPFTPVSRSSVRKIVAQQTSLNVVEIGLDSVMEGRDALRRILASLPDGVDLVVVDSVTGAHQSAIAEAAAMTRGPKLEWTIFDTGPFGAAYVRALGVSGAHVVTAPVLAMIGSPTEQSRLQANQLEDTTGAFLVQVADAIDVESVWRELQRHIEAGCPVVGVRTTGRNSSGSDSAKAEQILHFIVELTRECVARGKFSGVYASGGDVGVAVLKSLGAVGYAVETEVLPLAVCGAIVGGLYDGLGFATKGGLIGDETAAVECINALKDRHGMPEAIGPETLGNRSSSSQ